MAIVELINQEERFHQLSKPPIIANTIDTSTKDAREKFDAMLVTLYDCDTVRSAPQCSCGELKGLFHLGEQCDVCGDEVVEVFSKEVEADIWIVPLPGTGAFITPICWHILSRLMNVNSGFNSLLYLTDPYYRPTKPVNNRIKYLMEDKGHKRGLSYFYEHFDEVMHDYIHFKSKSIPKALRLLQQFVEHNRGKIFTRYLMVPNRILFPIEKSGKSNYGDKNMEGIIDGVRIIQECESRADTMSLKKMESRMVKVMEKFTKFHYEYVKSTIGGKPGIFRQHVLGGRWHFTTRAVVISIYEPHDFREVHYPWVSAINQFQIQLINKLIGRGLGLDEIHRLLKEHATRYHPLLDELFKELIDESPHIGLPIILQRNPTIRRPSAILVYVTKVKPNTNDNTISMSIGNLTGLNADFDGDQLNSVSLQDYVTYSNFVVLSPDHNVMDLSVPWQISDSLKMQSPVISTTANWISHGRRMAYGD